MSASTAVEASSRRPGGRPERSMMVPARIALLGNPNTGKTTLFNRLCGLRSKTANFPGVTVEARLGRTRLTSAQGRTVDAEFIDLPGVYRLALDLPESQLGAQLLKGTCPGFTGAPSCILVIVDATNLARNLRLVAEAREFGVPMVVALNMIDIAQRRGLTIDASRLSEFLGCPVVSVCAKSGVGFDVLCEALAHRCEEHQRDASGSSALDAFASPSMTIPKSDDLIALAEWAEQVVVASVGGTHAVGEPDDSFTDRLDAAFTHPVSGLLVFAALMAGLFMTIFWVASFPMNFIDWIFGTAAEFTSSAFPEGAIRDLVCDGVIAGVGSVVIFLPQICLLFFLISLLEDTGYLARAAFVMDRLLCRFGLPGQAFVPLLSSHACAIPGIMSTKLIPDWRDRFATILVAPFMSCSARVPVYVLLTGIMFGDRPLLAGVAFFGCYVLGALAGLFSALLVRTTILPGRSRPMILELPSYKMPSLRSALITMIDRAYVFLKNAGTVILGISVVLWWLSAYPTVDPPAQVVEMRAEAVQLTGADTDRATALFEQADRLEATDATSRSFIGRMGQMVEPVFAPIGCDWKLTIGVLTSFAAREVFVSTLGIITAGSDDVEDSGVLDRVQSATRDDGSPLFTMATSASLLVFYVLAMQCLPTLVVTKRETGSWKWAGLQLAYMTVVAYGCALIVYQGLGWFGVA